VRARAGILLAVLLAIAAGVLLLARWPGAGGDGAPPSGEPLPAAAAPAGEAIPADAVEAAERAVARARARRTNALFELSAAEAEIEDREREVEELERFIADLEARGEDPARHAEEGLALFRPAYDGYERTVARIEAAQAELRAADDELAAAEAALRVQRAGSAPGGADPAN
jgi:hypothetical protein